jgi:hypothetical protein
MGDKKYSYKQGLPQVADKNTPHLMDVGGDSTPYNDKELGNKKIEILFRSN